MGRTPPFLLFALLLWPAPVRADGPCATADSVVAVQRVGAPVDTIRLADALLELGRCRARTDPGEAARHAYDEGLALVAALTPPDPVREAAFRHEIGAMRLGRRDPDGAAPYLEAAWALRRRHLGEDAVETARTRLYLGVLALQSGRGREARADYDAALLSIEKSVGAVHPDYLWALNLKASYLQAMGEGGEARQLYVQVLAGRAALKMPPDPTEAWLLNNLAILLEAEGRYLEADSLFTRSWEIRRDQLGAVPLTARSLVNRGNLFFLKGDYAHAREFFEEAMRIFTAAELDRDPDMARCLRLLGMVYFWTGDVVSAGEHLERARALLGERGRTADRLGVMTGLSYCALARGDAAGAERWIRSGIALADGDSTVTTARRANLHIDLGRMLAARNDWDGSDRAFAAGMRLLEGETVPSALNLGCAAYELGEARLLAGRFREAATDLGRSLHWLEGKFEPDHPQLVLCWMGLARASAALGRPDAAATMALRAHRLQLEQVRTNLASLTERHALLLAHSLDEATGLCLATATSGNPSHIMATWDAVAATRGLVQRELTGRRPASRAAAARLDAARTRLANLYLRGPSGESDPAFAGLVAAARRERESAERAALGTASLHADRADAPRELPMAQLVDGLPTGAALVAFALTPDSLGPGVEAAEGRYVAFVGRPGRPPELVSLGRRADIDAAVSAWRAEAGDERHTLRDDPAAAERACAMAGARLRRAAWDPLAQAVEGASTVYLVPSGSLGLVSFAALPDTGGRFLAESSATFIVLDHERDCRPQPTASGVGLLALGDPDFDCCADPLLAGRGTRRDAGDCRAIAEGRFTALPATREEVIELADRWRRTAPDGTTADVLLGPEASESPLRARAAGHRVLHLATHGFALGDDCRPREWRAAGVLKGALGSGLVLSGADHWSAGTANAADGLLTAEEVASLDLSGVDLAVLSACESGAGTATAWEGLIGLRRAFTIAGVRHLVVSLWSVGDREARDWIGAFYRGYLEERLSPPEAGRRAAVELLAARRGAGRSIHPFYWAGFLTVGGGNGPSAGTSAAGKHQARP
jgi:CHAT domain-containing protein/tetratricopeptide (TPR) repeat protein